MSPISESVDPKTYNTLTASSIPEKSNTVVVMANPHRCTLRGNNFPYLTIPDHKVQSKLSTQAGFVRNIVAFFPRLYIHHDEVRIDDLME